MNDDPVEVVLCTGAVPLVRLHSPPHLRDVNAAVCGRIDGAFLLDGELPKLRGVVLAPIVLGPVLILETAKA